MKKKNKFLMIFNSYLLPHSILPQNIKSVWPLKELKTGTIPLLRYS